VTALSIWKRTRRRFTDRVTPDAVFQIAPGYLTGIRVAKKDGSVRNRFIRPFREAPLRPSFDRPNITEKEALLDFVGRAVKELRLSGGTVSLLVPEACVRVFVLTVESVPRTREEREAFVRWRVGRQMPHIPEDARIDHVLSAPRGPGRVVVAVARRAVIEEYESLFQRKGLKVGVVTIPTLSLAHFTGAGASGLLLNIEDDHASLFAVAGGEWALYRQKALAPDGGTARTFEQKVAQVAMEIANTVRFLEDKEKAKVDRVWVRTGLLDGGPEFLARLGGGVPFPVGPVEYEAPESWSAAERSLLAPLAGQIP
jgi:hypothetical protein